MSNDRDRTQRQLVARELHRDLARAQAAAQQLAATPLSPSPAQLQARRLAELLERSRDALDGLLLGDADTAARQATRIAPLIERVVAALDLEQRRVRCEVPSIVVNVDTVKLDRIVDHLLSAALAGSPPGSTVHLTVEAVPGGIRLAVAFDGRGRSGEVRAGRDAPSGGQDPDGRALIARFAQAHGGRFHTEVDGNRLVVELPRSADVPSAPAR